VPELRRGRRREAHDGPNCGYQYEEGDYTMSPEELGEKTPDEFQTEAPEEKLEAVTEEGDDG
jgi:hypothetical protein